MEFHPNSTDQSAPRVMHAGNMAARLPEPQPSFTKVQWAPIASSYFSFSRLL